MSDQNTSVQKVEKQNKKIIALLVVIAVMLIAVFSAIVTISIISDDKEDSSFSEVKGNKKPADKKEESSEKATDSSSQLITDANGNQVTQNSAPNNGGLNVTTPSDQNQDGADNKPTTMTKDEFIKLFNEETAKAANGTYKVKRSGTFVKPINVGNATDALNSIIKGVDKNADLNSVVGGFIGVKKAPIEGTATNGKYEGFEAKYALKGASLTAADITDFAVSPNGTQYAFHLGNVRNPDANSALAHVTNDYITFAEVNKGIFDSVGSAVKVEESGSTANYTKIAFVVTVVDGKITKITYSYTLSATFKIKLAVMSATGTGEADIKGEITDIKY